jgi:hypothetical protein
VRHSLPRIVVALAAACTLALTVGSCSGPTEEAPEDHLYMGLYDTTAGGLSHRIPFLCEQFDPPSEDMSVDFRPEITRSQVDSFSANHGLMVKDTLIYGNSYLLTLDRAVLPNTDIHEFCAALRRDFSDFIIFADPAVVVVDPATNYGFIRSSEIFKVSFMYEPDVAFYDTFTAVNGILRFPRDQWPEYVERQSHPPPWQHAQFEMFIVNRDRIPYTVGAPCVAFATYNKYRLLDIIDNIKTVHRPYSPS